MKNIRIIIISLILFSVSGLKLYSQKKILYDINADPLQQFEKAIKEAEKTNKHVMLQIGGNWCPWCFRFHDFYKNDAELDSLLKTNYVIINVNYDPKKKQELFTKLGFPQRFGFPVIVITDAAGNRLHTQNSWYLEDGKDSYNKEKFKSFLKNWTVEAINSENNY
ncbi:MAG: thioredoxin family protein [Bacteroidales bacterium]|nr:thioredoxin family protein [Bacteroidales bacterium]